MLSKQQVLASIQKLPNEFTMDQVIDQLMLIHAVEEGRKQIAAGEATSHEEVKKQFGR